MRGKGPTNNGGKTGDSLLFPNSDTLTPSCFRGKSGPTGGIRRASRAFPCFPPEEKTSPNTHRKVHENKPLLGRDTFWHTPSLIPTSDHCPSPKKSSQGLNVLLVMLNLTQACIQDKLLLRPARQPLHPLRILCDERRQLGFADGIVGQRHGRAGSGAHGD